MDSWNECSYSKSTCRIIIVGCGLGGLAAAIGIRKASFQVLILEQAAEVREVGAGIQLPPNASRILRRWDLLEALAPYCIKAHDIVLRSYRDGTVLSRQNLVPHCEQTYGYPHLDVHRADLHSVLLEEAKSLGVQIKFGARVSAIDFSKPTVHLHSGEVHDADIVLGCDGERSICREILFGHADPPQRSGDLGFRVVLKAEELRQRGGSLLELVESPEINAWFGPYMHVVSYLLKKEDLFNIFVSVPDLSTPDQAIPGPQEVAIAELRKHFGDWNPLLRALLDTAQETRRWTMVQTGDVLQWGHANGRFTLLGDAAHGMLPYLGQGAAQAIEDAGVLGTLFALCQHPTQLPRILSIYEQLRKPRTMEVRRRSREMRATHGYPDGPLQRERDRQLKQEPFEGCPNAWADPVFQRWLWGYDAFDVAHIAWESYMKGSFPGA